MSREIIAPACFSDGVVVRDAAVHDVAQMVAMIGNLARHHGDASRITEDHLHDDLFGQDRWAIGLVAESSSGLLGYALLLKLYHGQTGKRGIDLHHLFVVEQVRHAGIGRSLMRAVVQTARIHRCRFIRIGVHPENKDAQRFYEREGFQRQSQGGLRFRMDLADDRLPPAG